MQFFLFACLIFIVLPDGYLYSYLVPFQDRRVSVCTPSALLGSNNSKIVTVSVPNIAFDPQAAGFVMNLIVGGFI